MLQLMRTTDCQSALNIDSSVRGEEVVKVVHKRIGSFGIRLVSALIVSAIVWPAFSQTPDVIKKSIRNDAYLLMGAGLSVPGVAAYCDEYVERNPELLAAAADWNKRHQYILERTIQAMEWSGGMTATERENLDRLAFQLTKRLVEDAPDRVAYCRSVTKHIRDGSLDLSRREDTAAAVQRIRKAQVR